MIGQLPGVSLRHPVLYALNFAPEEQRTTLTTIWQLTHELDGLARILKPEVAAVKLPWWHDELEHWQRDEPRHPIMRALAGLAGHEHGPAAVRALFAATVQQQANPHCGEEAEFWSRCEQHSLGLGIVAAFLDADSAVAAGYRSVGAGALALERLMTAAADARAGHILLPLEPLARAGLDSHSLASEQANPVLIRIRRGLAEESRRRIAAGIDQIAPTPNLAGHRYALIMAALYDACGRRLTSRSAQRDWPAPWRQLWIAWRAGQRATAT